MNLLAGDLGGTKTLLAIYQWNNGLNKIYQKRYISKDWDSFYTIIQDFIKNIPERISQPEYGCIAIAGIISNGFCKLTNLNWEIDSQKLSKLTTIKCIEIINDFSVLIYGIKYFKESQYTSVQGNSPNNNSSLKGLIAIAGAGTGLGIARGLITNNEIIVLPSEGGHKEFPPRTDHEWELAKWLKKDLNLDRLSLERVVSGTGLGNIARWRLMQPDAALHPLRPLAEELNNKKNRGIDLPSLVSKAAESGDEIMAEVIKIWLSAYGSVLGDIALQELCHSGLWIAGGTAQKHIQGIKSNIFLHSFRNKGRFKEFLGTLPVIALLDPEAGLFSAGCRAHLLALKMGNLV